MRKWREKNREHLRKYSRNYFHNKIRKDPERWERTKNNTYALRRTYFLQNKKAIISALGGQCSICGYKRNLSALELHHPNGRSKEELNQKKGFHYFLAKKILTEFELQEITKDKVLLCSNCHMEIHHPDLSLPI